MTLILLSGGLDSTVAAFMQREQGLLTLALTFDYGQRAASREIAAAAAISRILGCEHQIVKIDLPKSKQFGALLNSDVSMPSLANSELDNLVLANQSAKAVWVPNRNGMLINWAAMHAEALGVDHIIVGFNIEEAATFPDNSKAFIEAINHSLHFSTANHVKVISPTVDLNKTEIVKQGRALGAPLELIWSCYENGPKPCTRCESCMRLARAIGK